MAHVSEFHDFNKIAHLEPVERNGVYERYNCPFCVKLRGKEDHDGKLYYNTRLRSGYCHKCNVAIVSDSYPQLTNIKTTFLEKVNKVIPVNYYNLSRWSTPVKYGSQVYQYLINRGLTGADIKLYQLRESDKFDAVVIPNTTDLTDPFITNFCQLRYTDPNTILRYADLPNSQKPVYGASLIGKNETIIVCEGVFSAIAASRKLIMPAVALYGKWISINQQKLLMEKTPKVIYLMLDGKELNSIISLAKQLMTFTTCMVTFLDYGKDPDETVNLREIFLNSTININFFTLAFLERIDRSKKLSIQDKWKYILQTIRK